MNTEGSPNPARSGAGILGLGAAACVACCAGPILGALGAIGIASAAGYLLAGSTALILGTVAAVVVRRPRRRRTACASPDDTVTFVATPGLGTTAREGLDGASTPARRRRDERSSDGHGRPVGS